jgi:tetratricopeptide (TPR) repeat protein
MGKHTEALQAFDKAIELAPNNAGVWDIKGVVLFHLGNLDAALKAFEKVTQLDPNNAKAWQHKAETLYQRNSFTEAKRHIDKALLLDSEDATSLNIKGAINLRLGLYDDAAKLFEQAYRNRSDYRFIHNQAASLARLRLIDEAEDKLKVAIDLASVAGDKKSEIEYRTELQRLKRRGYATIWVDWWFGNVGAWGWLKKSFASFLLLLLFIYLLVPLLTPNSELIQSQHKFWWLHVGMGWESYIVPVAAILLILLSPMIRSVGPRGVEMAPLLPSPEKELKDIIEKMQPKLE